jgi:hypothetical protein
MNWWDDIKCLGYVLVAISLFFGLAIGIGSTFFENPHEAEVCASLQKQGVECYLIEGPIFDECIIRNENVRE